jgi:predicted phage terminase large subunit-like protein
MSSNGLAGYYLGAPNLENVVRLGPQEGPQSAFIGCEADIAIYGGAAGGGKSFGLLLDPLRHWDNADFGGVVFRKTSVQVRNEGGLWDESMKLYSLFKARPREAVLSWQFPRGMSMSFSNLEYEKDVLNYQGAQIPWIGFDELTHFSENQFFYMLSRNRSTSGVKPCIRATCNPDPDSWVRKFISWWIGEDGLPIKSRSGVLRYFIRINDAIVWADSKEEIYKAYGSGPGIQPKSVTFIGAKLEDNKILMEKDPAYAGNLLALNRVDRARLKDGNWNVRAIAGMMFQREWFTVVDAVPAGWVQAIRFWDRAATRPSEKNKDPDWTRGLKLYKYPDGRFCVVDIKSLRDTPGQVEKLIKATASHDSVSVKVMSQQDPGSAGVAEAENFIKMLAGYYVQVMTTSRDKVTRAKPVSAQCEAGNIMVHRASWNDEFFDELENFSDNDKEYAHDDIVDVLSGAFNELSGGMSLADVL